MCMFLAHTLSQVKLQKRVVCYIETEHNIIYAYNYVYRLCMLIPAQGFAFATLKSKATAEKAIEAKTILISLDSLQKQQQRRLLRLKAL